MTAVTPASAATAAKKIDTAVATIAPSPFMVD
jgi:hypothetical protein